MRKLASPSAVLVANSISEALALPELAAKDSLRDSTNVNLLFSRNHGVSIVLIGKGR